MEAICRIPAKAAIYEFTIRSFHPEKDFGWSGLCFAGDNRRFSNTPSGQDSGPTSRIWHMIRINMASATTSTAITRSDPSRAAGAKQPHVYATAMNPRGSHRIADVRRDESSTALQIVGSYAGENDAMPGSEAMRNATGLSYVPSLNVYYELWLIANRSDWTLDAVLYVYGDGFPNCEAFLRDPAGQAVFLGTYVRFGAAPTTLMLNRRMAMIATSIRLPLTIDGRFRGEVGDALLTAKLGNTTPRYQSIGNWNARLRQGSPNAGHAMGLEKGLLRSLVCGMLGE